MPNISARLANPSLSNLFFAVLQVLAEGRYRDFVYAAYRLPCALANQTALIEDSTFNIVRLPIDRGPHRVFADGAHEFFVDETSLFVIKDGKRADIIRLSPGKYFPRRNVLVREGKIVLAEYGGRRLGFVTYEPARRIYVVDINRHDLASYDLAIHGVRHIHAVVEHEGNVTVSTGDAKKLWLKLLFRNGELEYERLNRLSLPGGFFCFDQVDDHLAFGTDNFGTVNSLVECSPGQYVQHYLPLNYLPRIVSSIKYDERLANIFFIAATSPPFEKHTLFRFEKSTTTFYRVCDLEQRSNIVRVAGKSVFIAPEVTFPI
jgi:hypothetical protein